MEQYYTIQESKRYAADMWDVVWLHNAYVEGLETPETAQKVADAMNQAYQEGIRYSKDRIREKLNDLLFE
jgi:hypothetical protein